MNKLSVKNFCKDLFAGSRRMLINFFGGGGTDAKKSVPGNKATTVLHISDLHSGFRFDYILWRDLVRHAKNIKPDIIVITGDLVNTPWRWSIWMVVTRLSAFRKSLRDETGKSHLEIFVVPGNHDTRVSGLFSVSWLLPTSLIFSVAGAICRLPFLTSCPLIPFLESFFFLIALVAIVLRLVTTRALARGKGKEFFISKAEILDGFNVGIIPFDSASIGARWAAGTVKRGALHSFIDLEEKFNTPADSMGLFWIAAVHHHPVPLPYDGGHEQMMIMTNAGKFLHELASYGVPLILHGHKHHQHYSKLSFQTHKSLDSQISILSASTPTERGGVGKFRHGFNVIAVDVEHRASVSVYSAKPTGETFIQDQNFVIADSAEMRRRRYESFQTDVGIECKKATFTTSIDVFGDAVIGREFNGFKSIGAQLQRIPGLFKVACLKGHIGTVETFSTSAAVPHMNVANVTRTVSEVSFEIDFDSAMLAAQVEVDFSIITQGNNMFALTTEQAKELYPEDSRSNEYMDWTIPEGFALRELKLVLQFGKTGVALSGVRLSRALNEASPWIPCEESVNFVPGDSSVTVTVLNPRPNSRYRLAWPPTKQSSKFSNHELGRSRTYRELLHSPTVDQLSKFSSILSVATAFAIGKVFIDTKLANVHAALFSYNSVTKVLRLIASNYEETDERYTSSYPYGLGLPGRAFKLNDIVTFDRAPLEGYENYLRGNNTVATNESQVLEGNAVAFPLRLVNEDRMVGPAFGILQISTDGWGGLISPDAPKHYDNMQLNVSKALQDVLDGL